MLSNALEKVLALVVVVGLFFLMLAASGGFNVR